MSYADKNAFYSDMVKKGPIDMCVREQALLTYIVAADLQDKALANSIIAGSYADVNAVTTAVVSGPNFATLGDDGAILAAVQGIWHTVAEARYPQGAVYTSGSLAGRPIPAHVVSADQPTVAPKI